MNNRGDEYEEIKSEFASHILFHPLRIYNGFDQVFERYVSRAIER